MSKTVKEIAMTIAELYQIRRDCLVNDDKDTVFFCYKAGKLVKTLSAYDAGFSCSKKEFASFDAIEYFNVESTITYTKSTNSCVEEVEEVEEVEQVEQVEEVENSKFDFWYEQFDTNREEAAVCRFEIQEKKKNIIDSFVDENQLWGDLSFVDAGDMADVHFETIAMNICDAAKTLCKQISKVWNY